jgi:xanthine dehydrogenase iron-sulfur cluster and FAD-binding subunit A
MCGNLCRCGTYVRIRKAIHAAGALAAKGGVGLLAARSKVQGAAGSRSDCRLCEVGERPLTDPHLPVNSKR